MIGIDQVIIRAGRWGVINLKDINGGALALNAVYCGRPIKPLMLAFLPECAPSFINNL
jgi:hypothetical protein